MFVKGDDILKESFPDGATVRFACNIGYTPATGRPVVTCNAGNWSRLTLTCQSEYQPFRFCIVHIYLSKMERIAGWVTIRFRRLILQQASSSHGVVKDSFECGSGHLD